MHNPKQSHYPLSWCLTIYAELHEKFGRGQDEFNKIWDITPELAASWLSKRERRWVNYKRLLQIWDNWERSCPGAYDDPQLLHNRIVLFKFMMKRWEKTA